MLQVFRDLTIDGPRSKLRAFVAELSKSLPQAWTRDNLREKQINERTVSGSQVVFHVAAMPERPSARLYLWHKTDQDTYSISNIVPESASELSMFQYNDIVEEFRKICAPIAKKLELNLSVTSDELDIANLLTARAMKALQSFESNANMASLHPFDRARWRRFLIFAYKDNVDLTAEKLGRWLVEERRWPDESAFRLVIEYEFALELLKDFDSEK